MAEAGVRFDGWLDGELVFPERLHYTVIASDLVARIHLAVAEWASLWEHNAAAWSTTRLDPVSAEQARSRLADLKQLTDRYQPSASRQHPAVTTIGARHGGRPDTEPPA